MKTDKELLELAAKAVGVIGGWVDDYNPCDCYDTQGYEITKTGILIGDHDSGNQRVWNPLTDDGDALRLAVKLDMLINPDNGTINTCSATGGFADVFEYIVGDKLAATRRAIVRAAAAIGEKL